MARARRCFLAILWLGLMLSVGCTEENVDSSENNGEGWIDRDAESENDADDNIDTTSPSDSGQDTAGDANTTDTAPPDSDVSDPDSQAPCTTNNDCSGDEICCSDGQEALCTTRENRQTGGICETDSQCLSDETCCDIQQIGNRCVDPNFCF